MNARNHLRQSTQSPLETNYVCALCSVYTAHIMCTSMKFEFVFMDRLWPKHEETKASNIYCSLISIKAHKMCRISNENLFSLDVAVLSGFRQTNYFSTSILLRISSATRTADGNLWDFVLVWQLFSHSKMRIHQWIWYNTYFPNSGATNIMRFVYLFAFLKNIGRNQYKFKNMKKSSA